MTSRDVVYHLWPRAIPVRFLDVRLGLVVRTEELDVQLRVPVAGGLVRKEPQGLVIPDGPAHLLVHVGLDELGAPVPVVAADEAGDGDVVQETGEHDLVARSALLGESGALQEMGGRAEAIAEEVEERRPGGHGSQARVGAHEVSSPVVGRPRHRHPGIALPGGEDHRLHHDPVQLLAHRVLGRLGPLQHRHPRLLPTLESARGSACMSACPSPGGATGALALARPSRSTVAAAARPVNAAPTREAPVERGTGRRPVARRASDQLDAHCPRGRRGQGGVAGHERSAERFGEGEISRVTGGGVVAQLPGSGPGRAGR